MATNDGGQHFAVGLDNCALGYSAQRCNLWCNRRLCNQRLGLRKYLRRQVALGCQGAFFGNLLGNFVIGNLLLLGYQLDTAVWIPDFSRLQNALAIEAVGVSRS